MNNDVWAKAERIFHAALNLPAKDRNLYLQQECAGDAVLFSEVESLLKSFEEHADLLDEPIFEKGLEVISIKPEKNLSGSLIGYYELQEKIGEGGMGEVYKAIDTRLNRRVALKFLSSSFKNDQAAKRRLVKEAQAVAMLEHPNVCAVHGIEQSDEHHFIVMQYIEGKTLAESLDHQTITGESFKSLARQIIDAVAFAHSHGVIHRDLKPGNIMLNSEGQIKVLDFGLAKIIPQKQILGNDSTEDISQFSQNGLVIGTVSYMSPEQLRGEKIDFRSDIFSLGIILYELLCKQNPFNRKSQAETIAAILSDNTVSAEKVTPKIPVKIVSLINKCLEKDRNKRFQSTAEVLVELENTNEVKDTGFLLGKYLRLNKYWFLILSFLTLLILGGLLYLSQSPKIPTFAILPIVNESNDTKINYLGEGLTEGLINKFTRFTKLKIKASTIVSKYKGQQIDPLVVGKELNVEAVMIGKIFKRENSAFFQADVIDAKDGNLIWRSKEFSLDKSNLINIQEEILTQVTSRLRVNLSVEETQSLNKVRTTFSEAEEQLFLGQYYLNHRDRTNIDRAILNFSKAIDIDPRYAEAWSGLADSYVFKSSPAYGSLTPKDSMNKAKAAIDQALKLDNNLGEVYNTLGLIKLKYDWNWEEAENSFLKSIEIKPDYAQPHYWYSHLLMLKKDFARARIEAEKASELDPLSSNNEVNVGRVYYYERQNDRAIQIFSRVLQDDPSNRSAAYMLGLTYMQKGLYQDAAKLLERFHENDKLYFAAPLGYTYGRLNRKADAQRILGELEEFSKNGEIVPPQEKAIIYLGLGNKEKAFELFRSSCEERFGSFPFVLTESIFDGVRSDSGFIALENCVQPSI